MVIPKLRQMLDAWPMCKYPLGSGGKRVTILLYFPDARSASIISSKKFRLFSSLIILSVTQILFGVYRKGKWLLDCPVYNLVNPFLLKRNAYFNIIIGITFHHIVFVYRFKQCFSSLANMQPCKFLHFGIAKVA